MSVLSEVKAELQFHGNKCGLRAFLAKQKPEDAKDFMRLILKTTIPQSAIHRALAKRGFTGGVSRVQFHRARGCRECTPKKGA